MNTWLWSSATVIAFNVLVDALLVWFVSPRSWPWLIMSVTVSVLLAYLTSIFIYWGGQVHKAMYIAQGQIAMAKIGAEE